MAHAEEQLLPKDLMLGDWVCYRIGKDKMSTPMQVCFISESEVYLTFDGNEDDPLIITEDELVPIPLTAEILQKNGFHFGNTTDEEEFSVNVGCGLPEPGWCYDECGGEVKIIFPNDTDGGLIRLDDGCCDRQMEFVFVNPIMVHELQHALRLYGIEKEIVI